MQTAIEVVYDGEVLRPQRPLRLEPNTHLSIVIEEPSESESDADILTDAAWKMYEERLKPLLEPSRLGEVVAIYPQSGDYEVAKNSPRAWKPLRRRQPEGKIVVVDIGPVDSHNPLTARNSGLRLGNRP